MQATMTARIEKSARIKLVALESLFQEDATVMTILAIHRFVNLTEGAKSSH